jgi:hypothetical protein
MTSISVSKRYPGAASSKAGDGEDKELMTLQEKK